MRGRRYTTLGLGVLSVVALSGWLVRRGAARAHVSGGAKLAPQPAGKDPAGLVSAVSTHADAAGVNPVLVLAILYNEAYKPHVPLLERAWQAFHRDSAFGVANMHRVAFERTKRGRPFADRAWKELPHDADLAVQAAAWHLHDLRADLPDSTTSSFTTDELLAMGYNSGARNMVRFARGRQPGPIARAYLERLREHWAQAEETLRQGSAHSGSAAVRGE